MLYFIIMSYYPSIYHNGIQSHQITSKNIDKVCAKLKDNKVVFVANKHLEIVGAFKMSGKAIMVGRGHGGIMAMHNSKVFLEECEWKLSETQDFKFHSIL